MTPSSAPESDITLVGIGNIGEQPPEDEFKNPKLTLFNLINALKFFYSFKSLEKKLGVPSQVLWRYTTLRATPEKDTAQKILAKIKELKLVEEAIQRTAAEKEDLWAVFSNPGVLQLTALKTLDEFKKTIDVVLSAPDVYSAALAAMIAAYMRARLCLPSHTPFAKNVIIESYINSFGSIDAIGLPRKCIPKKSKILIAASILKYDTLSPLLSLVQRIGAEVKGVVALASLEDGELLKNKLPQGIKVLTIIKLDEMNKYK
ncbi:hypothetical protein [Pyrodictium abyssi]|uniref:Uncharacterized protein n=1 Tax=Pyrodictium abyssi TaxID=54256 RepID=A0ABN6ZLL3_9CREN|nr:hypothetical protein PABY_07330 [Pyrodictium abyssi]